MSNIFELKSILKKIKEKELEVNYGLTLYKKAQSKTGTGLRVYRPTLVQTEIAGKNEWKGNLLIFSNSREEYESYASIGISNGTEPTGVIEGEAFLTGHNLYTLLPGQWEHYRRLVQDLKDMDKLPDRVIYTWHQEENSLSKRLEKGCYSILLFTKALMEIKNQKQVQLIFVVPTKEGFLPPEYGALEGFFRSLKKEDKRYCYQLYVTDGTMDGNWKNGELNVSLLKYWDVNPLDNPYVEIRQGSRFVKEYADISYTDHLKEISLIEKSGTYLITGGAKGIGYLIAEYMAKKYHCRLIIAGSSQEEGMVSEKLDRLKKLGACVEYYQIDMRQEEQVKRLAKEVGNLPLKGIIYCSGIKKDAYLLHQTPEDFMDVVSTKVTGAYYLDYYLEKAELDFFVTFSSISASLGNEGQCSYAYANSYLDNLTAKRAAAEKRNERHGVSVSINWPLWVGGGMSLPKEAEERMKETLGIVPIERELGTELFEEALKEGFPQFIPIYGEETITAEIFMEKENSPVQNKNSNKTDANPVEALKAMEHTVKDDTDRFLLGIFEQVLGIPAEKIDLTEKLQNYGMDSIMTNRFNYIIGEYIKNLPKTLLYDCLTLKDVSDYLIKEYSQELINVISVSPVPDNSIGDGAVTEPITADIRIDDIAVIGLAGRYPNAEDSNAFWENLMNGRDCIDKVPKERWDNEIYYSDDLQGARGKTYCDAGGFIKDADKFDAGFFGISPREAHSMDPQERLFLECAWHTFEDAGYPPEKLAKNYTVGIFAGVTTNTYMLYGETQLREDGEYLPKSHPWSIANRVSAIFNFKGPSIAIDTACSSSLTAIYTACESIRNGECDTALAGGVNLYLHPLKYVMLSQLKMLSPSGKCHSFGEGADGFVPGESVAAILLKPLKKAIEDKDYIYGVVKGAAINHGGETTGYTVPSPYSQAELILKAQQKAGIDLRTVSYIEAHGTGTSLGDPIEIDGLTKAFKCSTEDKGFCGIGSVKSNIGHGEAAAGVVSVIKVLLQMKYQKLVPSLHAVPGNTKITFDNTPFYVVDTLREWKRPVIKKDGQEIIYPRRAGISALGAGGSNAHVIIEEYISEGETLKADTIERQVLTVSARTEKALRVYVQSLLDYIQNSRDSINHRECFNGFMYTLQLGRAELEERLAFTASDFEEVISGLKAYLGGESTKIVYTANSKDYKPFELSMDNAKGLEELAKKWTKGGNVDWRKVFPYQYTKPISLPLYPFEKKSYWIDLTKPERTKPATHMQSDHLPKIDNEEEKETMMPVFDIDSELKQFTTQVKGDEVRLEIINDCIAILYMEDKAGSNMLSKGLYYMLLLKLKEIQQDIRIKAIVLTGFDRIFCMGGTYENLTEIAEKKEKCSTGSIIFQGLLSCKVPVISAMQGHAMGGGFVLGLFADIIVMSEESIYSANFMRYGFTPGVGATYILEKKLGSSLAMEMMYTANEYTGAELKQRGVTFLFTSRDKVVAKALRLAEAIAGKPLKSLQVLKKELAGRELKKLPAVIESEVSMHDTIFENQEELKATDRIQRYFKPEVLKLKSGDMVGIDEECLHLQQGKLVLKETAATAESKTITHLYGKPSICLKSPLESCVSKAENLRNYEPVSEVVNKTVSTHETKVFPKVTDTRIRAELLDIAAGILRMPREELNPRLSFKELGMDSISGVELIREINSRYHTNLEAVVIYDYPDVNSFLAYVAGITGIPASFSGNPSNPTENAREVSAEVIENIKAALCRILRLDTKELDLRKSMKDLGMDSITGLELIRDINRMFNLNLEAVVIYDYSDAGSFIREVAGMTVQTSNSSAVIQEVKENTQPEEEESIEELTDILQKLQADELNINEVDRYLEGLEWE